MLLGYGMGICYKIHIEDENGVKYEKKTIKY